MLSVVLTLLAFIVFSSTCTTDSTSNKICAKHPLAKWWKIAFFLMGDYFMTNKNNKNWCFKNLCILLENQISRIIKPYAHWSFFTCKYDKFTFQIIQTMILHVMKWFSFMTKKLLLKVANQKLLIAISVLKIVIKNTFFRNDYAFLHYHWKPTVA